MRSNTYIPLFYIGYYIKIPQIKDLPKLSTMDPFFLTLASNSSFFLNEGFLEGEIFFGGDKLGFSLDSRKND